jgi:hypothetical protein
LIGEKPATPAKEKNITKNSFEANSSFGLQHTVEKDFAQAFAFIVYSPSANIENG